MKLIKEENQKKASTLQSYMVSWLVVELKTFGEGVIIKEEKCLCNSINVAGIDSKVEKPL